MVMVCYRWRGDVVVGGVAAVRRYSQLKPASVCPSENDVCWVLTVKAPDSKIKQRKHSVSKESTSATEISGGGKITEVA